MTTTTTPVSETSRTCPDWCRIEADQHDPWDLGPTDGGDLEQYHEAPLLDMPGMSVRVMGPDRLFLDFEAIQGGATIADSSRFDRPTPVVQVDLPNAPELKRWQLRQLHQALTEALAIVDAHTVPGDPMDESDKQPRIDGGGCIWEWDGLMRMWAHAGEELEPSTTLTEIDAAAGPISFWGAP